MLYKFFEDTLPGRFIKHLLRSAPIPRFKLIEQEDYLVKDRCYLYQGLIIKCVKSGVFKHVPPDILYPSDILFPTYYDDEATAGENVFPGTANPYAAKLLTAQYKVLRYYDPEDLTAQYNYHSKHLWHDSDTHYHLGEYIRYLKYEKGLNLLPYYNCFNYKSTVNLTPPAHRKYLLASVKFNRTYTIALNSPQGFTVTGVLYNEFLGEYGTVFSINYPLATFSNPFVLNTGNPRLQMESSIIPASHERDFHLKFELASNNETGLVVLEGDYRNSNSSMITSFPHERGPINLSLLKVDNNISYAFSSRLIEYLLLHVICEQDQVSDNISRVQRQLTNLNIPAYTVPVTDTDTKMFDDYKEKLIDGAATYGVWDNDLTGKINYYIDYLLNKGYPLIDQDGNVNSQLEEYLRKGVV